jgi:hypothetical protein
MMQRGKGTLAPGGGCCRRRYAMNLETSMSESTDNGTGASWEARQNDAYSGAAEAAADARSRLTQAAAQLEQTYTKVSEDAARLMRDAREEATKRYAELEERLKQQPLMGIGLGVMLGMLLTVAMSGNKTIVIRERPRH